MGLYDGGFVHAHPAFVFHQVVFEESARFFALPGVGDGGKGMVVELGEDLFDTGLAAVKVGCDKRSMRRAECCPLGDDFAFDVLAQQLQLRGLDFWLLSGSAQQRLLPPREIGEDLRQRLRGILEGRRSVITRFLRLCRWIDNGFLGLFGAQAQQLKAVAQDRGDFRRQEVQVMQQIRPNGQHDFHPGLAFQFGYGCRVECPRVQPFADALADGCG